MDQPAVAKRRPYFLIGVLLFILGPAAYVAQVSMKQLTTPWYAPILATLGVVLMVLSVRERSGLWRKIALGAFALFCAVEWYLIGYVIKTPAYAGPAQPGRKVPSFEAQLANGNAFTQQDLETGPPTAMIFFRGRW